MIVLQLPVFLNRWFLDGKELQAQRRIGLAWQRVAEFFFFGCGRREPSEAETCHSSKIVWLLYFMLFWFEN